MKQVNLLIGHEIEPIMVFDGASLPMKGSKHLERRRWVAVQTEVGNIEIFATTTPYLIDPEW